MYNLLAHPYFWIANMNIIQNYIQILFNSYDFKAFRACQNGNFSKSEVFLVTCYDAVASGIYSGLILQSIFKT